MKFQDPVMINQPLYFKMDIGYMSPETGGLNPQQFFNDSFTAWFTRQKWCLEVQDT